MICDNGGKSSEEWVKQVNFQENNEKESQRPDSVSSIQSLNTSNEYAAFKLNVGGRHSRLGLHTPSGGNIHYSRKEQRITPRGDQRAQRVESIMSRNDPVEYLTMACLVKQNDEPKTLRFSDSTEQIHNMFTNRHTQQIRSASPADFRNQAQSVFHLSPLDCFSSSHITPRLPTSTTHPSFLSLSRHISRASSKEESNTYNVYNWRGQVKQLFDDFNFQFSPSFRKGVVMDLETGESNLPSSDIPSIRPPSVSTDIDSETESVTSKPKYAGRKQSVTLKAGLIGTLLVAADHRTRRLSVSSSVSTLSTKHRKRQNN